MLTVWLLSAAVFALALLGMAVGVLFGRAPLSGSCGGLARSGLECGVCDRPCARKRRAGCAPRQER